MNHDGKTPLRTLAVFLCVHLDGVCLFDLVLDQCESDCLVVFNSSGGYVLAYRDLPLKLCNSFAQISCRLLVANTLSSVQSGLRQDSL